MSRPNLTNRTVQHIRWYLQHEGTLNAQTCRVAAENAAVDIGFFVPVNEAPDYYSEIEADEEWDRQLDAAAAEAKNIVEEGL